MCDPLAASAHGAPIVEDLSFTVEANQLVGHSVTKFKNGQRFALDFRAK